ncbi:MAG: protein kinase [Acidobacteriota bacterium]
MAKLLVSDDDPQILKIVSLVLEEAGHDVVSTSDPREVPTLALDVDPDVIVLDVMMPVSGFELLGALRDDQRTAPVPILFLSGLGGGADRVRGLSEGADDYLVKPFEPAELVLRVERLAQWRGQQGEPRPAVDGGDFGRYEVLGVLGEGSMGTVYRGRDPRLEREVALKTIRLDAATTAAGREELLDLLRREAITIARLSHPNVVAVYDMGGGRNSAFVAMELVNGTSLGDLLNRRGPLPSSRVVPLALGIARGLASTHARQVIHRDVKPGNVLLGVEGEIKVTDFGLSYVVSSVLGQRMTELSGTPGYVPPEVLRQGPYTEAGDLFGLGATLYESLAGFHPFAGESLRDTILQTLSGEVRPLDESVVDLPDGLAEMVLELLAVDPEQRPSAEVVARRLERMATAGGFRWSAQDLLPRDERSLASGGET